MFVSNMLSLLAFRFLSTIREAQNFECSEDYSIIDLNYNSGRLRKGKRGNGIVRNTLIYLNYMQSKEAKIAQEIEKLISAIHRNANTQLRSNIQSFSRKVFSSGSGRPNSDSLQELREKVIIKVTNSHDQRTVLQCQDITHRFLSNNTLTRKAEILRMLIKLSELANRQEEDIANVFRDVRKRELNVSLDTTLSQVSQIVPQPRRSGQMAEQLRVIRNRGCVEEGLTEGELVRQLSFTFTNTSSSQIIETVDGYQLKNSLNVSDTVKRMVAELADLGWLHRKITKCAEKEGAVRKALRLAVNQELNQFYRWIGTMQNMAKEGRLTLRKLTVWSFYPQSILKWLAVILQAVEPFEGCQVISILNSYRPSGLAAVNALLNRLLAYVLQPLLNYIHRWTYKGQLLDSKGEFFIGENKRVGDSDEWQERFRLVAENIPNILDSECARMIFNTGKAIFFLVNRCKVLYEVRTPFIDTRDLNSLTAASTNSLVSPAFLGWLRAVHDEVNAVLVQTLFSQFHLRYHLESMKHFFLCGKGDFIQHLYDNLREKLSLKKQEITEHSLDGYISDAILKCCSDFKIDSNTSFRSAVADRLLAKKMETTGSEGWDCFNFQYSLQRIQPLRTILSPSALLNYQKVFAFLWRVKQVEQTLKSLWVLQSRQQSLRMRRTKSRQLRGIFHYIYLLRSAMSHFLTNLHSYLMVTIQAAWNSFSQQIESARTFDDILRKHREFQEQILQITLSTARDKNLQVSLGNIFTVIGNFRNVYTRLMDNFEEYYEKLRLYEDRQAMARRGIAVQALQIPEFSLNKSDKDMREVRSCFDTTFKNLFLQMRKEGERERGAGSLSVLAAKLDFSEYYSSLLLE